MPCNIEAEYPLTLTLANFDLYCSKFRPGWHSLSLRRLFSRGSPSCQARASHNLLHLWRRPKPVLLKVRLRCRGEERRNPPSTSASIFLTVGGGESERGELRSLNPVWPLLRRQKNLNSALPLSVSHSSPHNILVPADWEGRGQP